MELIFPVARVVFNIIVDIVLLCVSVLLVRTFHMWYIDYCRRKNIRVGNLWLIPAGIIAGSLIMIAIKIWF